MASTASGDAERRAHFTYLWNIEYARKNTTLTSPVFTVPSMEMTRWKLVINFLDLYLHIERNEEDDGPESIEVDFQLSFLDTGGSPLVKESESGHFRKGSSSERYLFPIDALLVKRGDLCFPKYLLTIQCQLWRKGTDTSEYELCFATTRCYNYRASFVWPVKGFSSLKLGEKRKRILYFGENGCEQLILLFSLGKENGKECAFIHLETPTSTSVFWIWSDIALLNAERVVFHKYPNYTYKVTGRRFIKLGVFEKTEAAALLSHDVLLLRCEFELFPFVPAWSRIDDYKLIDDLNSRIVQTEKRGMDSKVINETAVCPFKEIVNTFKEEGTLSDVSLRAGTKSFPVHKLILSSRSPVFRAMFTEDMREKTSKCIDIPDMDADTLGRLLSYIYMDTLQELTWEKAVDLYEAADEYALLDLKEKCSSVLKSNISESSACKILVIADLHQDESLKKSVQHFMQNDPEIMHSDVWKAFRKEHSELALETAEQIIFNLKCSRS